MDLCPFETVASAGGDTISPFCALFTASEWDYYNYYQTLGKWYGNGPGNFLGSTQGVGWVNELIARLTSHKVVPGAAVNSTLDSAKATFPLGKALYADFVSRPFSSSSPLLIPLRTSYSPWFPLTDHVPLFSVI